LKKYKKSVGNRKDSSFKTDERGSISVQKPRNDSLSTFREDKNEDGQNKVSEFLQKTLEIQNTAEDLIFPNIKKPNPY
jgi:hypothetical protein